MSDRKDAERVIFESGFGVALSAEGSVDMVVVVEGVPNADC